MANPAADAKPAEKDRPAAEVKLLSKEEFEKKFPPKQEPRK